MKVHRNEGVAIHIGPEPCAGVREGVGEASVGERAGQPLSHERVADSGRRRCSRSGRQHGGVRHRKHLGDPAGSENLACTHAPCTGTGRSPVWPLAVCKGPHREGEEPKPMMHGPEKSDSSIVARKPANKPGPPSAESVEPREGTEGNADKPRHAPDAEPGQRVPGAGTRTSSSKGKEEGTVHGASAPCDGRSAAGGLLSRSSGMRRPGWTE